MNPTLENFEELFERKGEVRGFVGDALRRSYPFLDWLENTLVVFAGSVAATLGASVAAAYALGRLRPPGFRWWRRVIFATYVIPQTILFVPLYQVVNALGLDDNLLALLLIYPSMALPFCVWMLSAYFQHLPREIEEAALIEGASRATAFFRIILPMSRPVLVAAGIFTLGTIASDFMIASVFLLTQHNQTITAGLGTMDVALDELAGGGGGQSDGDPRGRDLRRLRAGLCPRPHRLNGGGSVGRPPIRAHLRACGAAARSQIARLASGGGSRGASTPRARPSGVSSQLDASRPAHGRLLAPPPPSTVPLRAPALPAQPNLGEASAGGRRGPPPKFIGCRWKRYG